MAETPLDHAVIIMNLGIVLGNFVKEHHLGLVCAESAQYRVTLEDGTEAIRQADVSFIATDDPKNVIQQSPHPGSPPLAVEVVSEWDAYAQVRRKTRMWLNNGAQMVWVVDHDQRVSVHRPQTPPVELTPGQQIDGGRLLPGFACDISEFYP